MPTLSISLVQLIPVPGSNYLAASLQHGIVVIFDNNYDVDTYKVFLDIRGRTVSAYFLLEQFAFNIFNGPCTKIYLVLL